MRFRALLLLAAFGCSSTPTTVSTPAALDLVTGGGPGVAGYPLGQPVVVRLTDQLGRPVAGAELSVATSAPFAAVSADDWKTDADGRVSFQWRMGASPDGETVTVSVSGSTAVDPLIVTATGGTRPVRAIAGGLYGYCAVTLDGRIGCWEPFDGAVFPEIPAAPPVMDLHPGIERFVDVAMSDHPFPGLATTCGVRTDGGVSCTSYLGHADGFSTFTDVGGAHPPFTRIFANHQGTTTFFCALTGSGEAWCWGDNSRGQLGTGTMEWAAVPVKLATEAHFQQLTLGGYHACGLDLDGAAWCWGANASGATGVGTFTGHTLEPTAVATSLQFESIQVVADDATCAMTAAESWWCWGSDAGTALSGNRSEPVEARFRSGTRLAAPDNLGLASDGTGSGQWWGDLYPTLDLVIASDPLDVTLPFAVTRFAPAVRDMAACTDTGDGQRWLCTDLLWLWMRNSPGSLWEKPLVHGVP